MQQRRRSRAQIKHEGGSRVFYPDHVGTVVHGYHLYLMPLFSEAGDKEPVWTPSPPQTNLGKAPSLPLQVHTPHPAKMKIEASLGGNHTSASDLRSEAADWARGGCGDHFGLFSASVRGQGGELKARAGQLAPLL